MPPSSNSSENFQRRNRQPLPGRMGMRKWLEELLDNGLCQGLEWEDKEKKIFSIFWKHASSHGFDRSKHADVFLQWARHKGKTAVKEDRNQKKKKTKDHYDSKYKSNFRCALHSLIDCIELPGDEESPKKFFQFIDPTNPLYKVRRDKKRNSYSKKAKKRTHDGKFSDGGKNTSEVAVPKEEPKDSCQSNENEILTFQEAESGKAFQSDQNTEESLAENPYQPPGQSSQTLPYLACFQRETGNMAIPSIILLPKETPGKVEIMYGETSQGSTSALPNFEALGVKDQYGPKTYMHSTLLASGGDVSIKKEAEETPVEPISVELQLSEVNVEHALTSTNQEAVEDLFDLIDEKPSQETDMNNMMLISGDQEPFNNPFLPYAEDSGVITRSTDILNNIETTFAGNMEDDFTSEPEPFCDSY